MLLNLTKYRYYEMGNTELLRDAVRCFVMQGLRNAQPVKIQSKFTWKGQRDISFYEAEFEIQFLSNLRVEYEAKANLWVASCNATEYL